MNVFRVNMFLGMSFCLLIISPLNAQSQLSELEAGAVYQNTISATDYNELIDFGFSPASGKAGDIFEIIQNAFPDSNFKKIRSWQRFIVFIGIGGVNRFVYFKSRERRTGIYEDPVSIEIGPAKSFWGMYITDASFTFENHVEVEITGFRQSSHVSSLEAHSRSGPLGKTKAPMKLEIGIKRFEIPIAPAVLNIIFTRKDRDTYEKQSWNQSFRVRNIKEFGLTFEFLVPFSEVEIVRYEIVSNQITLDRKKRRVFFNLDFTLSGFRKISGYYGPQNLQYYFYRLIPDVALGIGLPLDTGRWNDNSIYFGLGWPIALDLVKFTLGWHFFESQKLKPNFNIGDPIAGQMQLDDIVTKIDKSEFIIGLSFNLSHLDRLLTQL